MMGRFALALAATTIAGFASPASAADERLATGLIYGAPGQSRGVCYFTNLSNASITIRNFAIRGIDVGSLPLSINECGSASGATLIARRSCGIAANVSNEAFACSVVTSDAKNTRGTFEIRDASQSVRNSQALD